LTGETPPRKVKISMNKRNLVKKLAKKQGIPSSRANEMLGLALDLIVNELAAGKSVSISGFGSFVLSKRKSGVGFNPHTKEKISLKEVLTVKFRPSKELKTRLND
jgi:nucleoid DNA-binding protein